ncbi:MAG: alkaline phosphatase family protein [Chloroflexota bacterium]
MGGGTGRGCREDVNVVVMSDHGAGPLYRDVFLNEWLWQKGWLALRDEAAAPQGWHQAMRRIGLTREHISNALTRLDMHWAEVAIKRVLGDRIRVLPRDERLEFTNAVDWSRTKGLQLWVLRSDIPQSQGARAAGSC